jgi:hypothetical protein
VPAVFTVENIRKVVAGGAFTKSNKCAVQSHNAVLLKVTEITITKKPANRLAKVILEAM